MVESAGKAPGPWVYENWRAQLAAPARDVYRAEFALYSDAHLSGGGQDEFGPYLLIRACAPRLPGSAVPIAYVRVHYHAANHREGMLDAEQSDASRYHGGTGEDEFAALVSLALGVRAMAGPIERTFKRQDGPEGRPRACAPAEAPALYRRPRWAPVLPGCLAPKSFDSASPVRSLPSLDAPDATRLVKAARLYQQALWVADLQPEWAWLLLVSAVEAITYRDDESIADQLAAVARWNHKLVALCRAAGGETHVHEVAAAVRRFTGSTEKFVGYLLANLPDPPASRPPPDGQIPWSDTALEEVFRTVYKHRSVALHDGIPFPAPMCHSPYEANGGFQEVPGGVAWGLHGNSWASKDVPILLHVFEHCVRGAILKWWRSRAAAR